MADDNYIDFKCPHCGTPASFVETVVGTAQECPHCSESVLVPRASCEVGAKLPIPMSTPRLTLRRLHPGDWKDLLELMAGESLFRYLEGSPLEEPDILRWLERDQHVKLTQAGEWLHLALERLDGHKLIGYASMYFMDEAHRQAAFSLVVSEGSQRQGFGTEAARALLVFGFTGLGLHRMTAHCDNRNLAGCRLLEKAGLRREGEFREDRFVKGEWVSTAWYALLAAEFEARSHV